jgi:hypothetical protein
VPIAQGERLERLGRRVDQPCWETLSRA